MNNEVVDKNGNITTLRGDWLPLTFSPKDKDGNPYKFQKDDVIRFKIFKKNKCDCIELQKDFETVEGSTSIDLDLLASEMKIGDIISKPVEYWYEIILNPETDYEITLVGYKNENVGPKTLTLMPEGGEKDA